MNKTKPVRVQYIERGEDRFFISVNEAHRVTGVSTSTIDRIIDKIVLNPRKKYDKYTNEEIEFYLAKESDLNKDQLERKRKLDFQHSPLYIIYLDGKKEKIFCENTRIAVDILGINSGGQFYSVLNPKINILTLLDKKTNRRVTLIDAKSTEEEIQLHLIRVENRVNNQRVRVKMFYLDNYDQDMEEGILFDSLEEAAKSIGRNHSMVSKVLYGRKLVYTTNRYNQRRVRFESVG